MPVHGGRPGPQGGPALQRWHTAAPEVPPQDPGQPGREYLCDPVCNVTDRYMYIRITGLQVSNCNFLLITVDTSLVLY